MSEQPPEAPEVPEDVEVEDAGALARRLIVMSE